MCRILLKNVIIDGVKSDILTENECIAAAGSAGSVTAPVDYTIDGRGRLAAALPFYNTHCHEAMTLLRGYADDLELFDWLNNYIWPAEAKMDGNDIYQGTRLGIVEMIHSGCCYFNDMYWFQEQAIQAASELGIRADIGLLHLTTPGGDEVKDCDRSNARVLELAKNLPARIRIAYAPHAIYTVSGEALKRIALSAKSSGRWIHIHCSETLQEVEDCRKLHDGLTPVEYLHSLGVLGEHTLLAHCVHLTDHDRELIAGTKSVISHCPVSNMKLCSGLFDFEKAKAAGCRITIGTDGASSNNNLSMLEEIKFAAMAAKLSSGKPTAGRDCDILKCATEAGAEVAGVNAGLKAGCAADIMLVDLDSCQMVGDYSFAANLVYSADTSAVHTLLCAGKVLMENHRIPGEEEIVDSARKCCDKFRR